MCIYIYVCIYVCVLPELKLFQDRQANRQANRFQTSVGVWVVVVVVVIEHSTHHYS